MLSRLDVPAATLGDFPSFVASFNLKVTPSAELVSEVEAAEYEIAACREKGEVEGEYVNTLRQVISVGQAELARRRRLEKYGAPKVPGRSPISGELVAELKHRVNLTDIAERLLGQAAQRRGKIDWLICPVHHESQPSFAVYYEEQRYHCFGCKANGDVLGLIQAVRHCGFQEALAIMCDLGGLPLPEVKQPEAPRGFRGFEPCNPR